MLIEKNNQIDGAEVLVKSTIDRGVEICFANAGTTELLIVVEMDKARGITKECWILKTR